MLLVATKHKLVRHFHSASFRHSDVEGKRLAKNVAPAGCGALPIRPALITHRYVSECNLWHSKKSGVRPDAVDADDVMLQLLLFDSFQFGKKEAAREIATALLQDDINLKGRTSVHVAARRRHDCDAQIIGQAQALTMTFLLTTLV